MAEPRILPSADLDDGIQIGDGSSIWHLAQVRGGAEIGENVIVGRGAYIGSGVHVGDNCKIQNYALVYEPAHLEDGVFVARRGADQRHLPSRRQPRRHIEERPRLGTGRVTLKRGSSVGARAVCVAPVTIGEWATVAAGSVVTRDVPAYALVAGGSGPAHQMGGPLRFPPGGNRSQHIP